MSPAMDTAPVCCRDPAHLVPRSAGGCDDPRCVVPLCRRLFPLADPDASLQTAFGCHKAYDEGELDLHPRLARGGYEEELAHDISAHGLTPYELLCRVTNEVWVPRREFEVAQARIVELEASIAA